MILLAILATAGCTFAVIFWANHRALQARKDRVDKVIAAIYDQLDGVTGATSKDQDAIDYVRDACVDPEGVLGGLLIDRDADGLARY